MLGTRQRVLVHGLSKKCASDIAARTDNNRVVNIPGTPDMIGQFIDINVTEVLTHSLRGEIATPVRELESA